MLSFHRLVSLVVLIVGIETTAFSQTANSLPKSYIPPSPNAANLGLYTSVPVDPYTGVPDIKVPIHTFKINGLDLDVNLSYHAGGIRYSDEASWVGLGWSLNAGGVIARTKRAKDDLGPNGYYKFNKTGIPCEDIPDGEPDLFHFNFAGYTGKFILDYNGGSSTPNIRKLVKDGLKITLTPTGGWNIVDENGITYEFEQKETTKDVFNRPGASTETETYTSSWYLTKISNIYGEAIDFYYTNTGNKFYKNIHSNSSTHIVGCYPAELFSSFYMIGNLTGLSYYHTLTGSSVSATNEVTTNEIVLTSISCHYDYLYFIAGDRTDARLENTGAAAKKLDQIVLRSRGYLGTPYDAVIKTYNLNYDYFNSQSGQPDYISQRLQLKNIQETAGSTTVPPFVFSYAAGTLPDKNNWGEFVGVPIGLLNKIDYPTGGSTSYEYEPNTGFRGARIKKISQTDFTGTYNTRYFEYLGGKTLGQSTPIGGHPFTTQVEAVLAGTGGQVTASVFWMMDYSIDNLMMGESSASYLGGYDQVIEYSGPSGEFGKTVYTYKNDQSAQVYGVPADVSNADGFLLSKEDFAYVNNSYIPVKTIRRQPNLQNQFTVQAYRKIPDFSCNNTSYIVKSDWLQLSSESETTYDQNGGNPLTRTTTYAYNNPAYVYPTSKHYVDSKNAAWDTYYKYTDDRTVEGGVYTLMSQKNIVKQLEEVVTKNNVIVTRTKTNYKDWNQNGRIAPETKQFQKFNSDVETRFRYYAYNELGRPTESGGEDNSRTRYIWGYQNTLPIAEVKMPNIGDYSELVPETMELMGGGLAQVTSLGELGTLSVDHIQTVNLNGALTRIAGDVGEIREFRIILKDINTDQEVFNNMYYPPQTINESISLPQGNYRIYYVFVGYIDGDLPTAQIGFSLSATTSRYNVYPSCFYTSFEEDGFGAYLSSALTGVNVNRGAYFLTPPGQPGQYKLTYWTKPENGGTWELKQQIITVSGPNGPQITIGADGYVIDEVRLYPVGALMTSYTYDPQRGMTSKNDEKNQITYYEYDELGRLKTILDHNRNILKTFTYSFQEQQ